MKTKEEAFEEFVTSFPRPYPEAEEQFTVEEWGDIKNFISKVWDASREVEKKRIIELLYKEICYTNSVFKDKTGKFKVIETREQKAQKKMLCKLLHLIKEVT